MNVTRVSASAMVRKGNAAMLKDKVAIVTGSTSGIGLGIAKALAGEGADIMLNGFGEWGEIKAIQADIERDHGVRAVHDGADISKPAAVRRLVAATIEKLGRVDILVNNAGIQFTAAVEDFPAEK
jgi:3-hydroxybutyrate dehydrogenase